MQKITLITDSTWDRDNKISEDMDIKVIPLNVHFSEEQYLDGIDLTQEKFVKKLEESEELPTTSQPTPFQFEEVFREELEKGNKVLYIGIASKLSGTFNSANIAKESISNDNIYLIDSETVSAGLAILLKIAYDLIQEGRKIDEIVNQIESIKLKVKMCGYVDTLKYLHKGGRLSSTQAFIGSVLNVKPILSMQLGEITSLDKARGKKSAIKKVVEIFDKEKFDSNYPIAFAHINAVEELDLLIEEIAVKNNIEDYWTQDLGSVVGTHVGPGTIMVGFVKK